MMLAWWAVTHGAGQQGTPWEGVALTGALVAAALVGVLALLALLVVLLAPLMAWGEGGE